MVDDDSVVRHDHRGHLFSRCGQTEKRDRMIQNEKGEVQSVLVIILVVKPFYIPVEDERAAGTEQLSESAAHGGIVYDEFSRENRGKAV